MVRVDNVVVLLRHLLCPFSVTPAERDLLRKQMIKTLKNHAESGISYQLASSPLVWMDVEAIASTVKLAVLRELRGKDALDAWEQVYGVAPKFFRVFRAPQ